MRIKHVFFNLLILITTSTVLAAPPSPYKSLTTCMSSTLMAYVGYPRPFHRMYGNIGADDKQDMVLMEGSNLNSNGIFAFNENGAYFYKYSKSPRALRGAKEHPMFADDVWMLISLLQEENLFRLTMI